MMISLLAPEAMFIKAYDDWTKTAECMSILIRKSSNGSIKSEFISFSGERPDCDWTETHGFFAFMGGFQLVKEDGSTKQLRKLEPFQSILSGEIDIPKIRLEEIMDRSKGDDIAKVIALIQTTWFAMQVINRAAQHLPITALEITTLAHVSLNVLIYWCWWNKPLNIRFPVDVYSKKKDGADLAIDEVRMEGDTGAEVRDHDSPTECDTRDKEEPILLSTERLNDEVHSQCTKDEGDQTAAEDVQLAPTFEGVLKKKLTTTEIPSDIGEKQDPRRNPEPGNVPMAEGYSRMNIPPDDQGANECVTLLDTVNDKESQQTRRRLSIRIKIGAYFGDMTGSWAFRVVVGIPYCAIVAIFGAIHCIAWDLDFATQLESTLWRTSSIIVTVMPSIFVASVMVSANIYDGILPPSSLLAHGLMLFVIVPGYFFGRVCLLVLSLLALRSLPEDAYLVPSWTLYVPHIG